MKPFDSLEFRVQRRRKTKEKNFKSVNGFDTETENGKVFLIADSEGNTKEIKEFKDIAEFLLKKKNQGSLNFFYNLRFDFESFLQYLNEDSLNELRDKGKTKFQDYKIKWIPKKYFSISKGHHTAGFYDVAQFFRMSLKNAVQYYGLENKDFNKWIEFKEIRNDIYQYYLKHRQKIEWYCFQDAFYTKQLGLLFYNKLKKVGFNPIHFYSSGSLAQDYFLQKCRIPSLITGKKNNLIFAVPKEALKYAWNSYYGGRFEVLKKGYFKKAYIYDLSSAYPSEIKDLIDITKGTWHKVNEFKEDAYYGFYHIRVLFAGLKIAPLPKRLKNGLVVYPEGSFETYTTQKELEFILKNKIGSVQVIDGWIFYPYEQKFVFREEIQKIYELKTKSKEKDKVFYLIYKLLMNSLYGKFAQAVNHKTGSLWNPVYASVLCSNTRVKLLQKSLGIENHVIAFHTDSIISDIPLSHSKGLGKWEFKDSGQLVVLMSGIYTLKGVKLHKGSRGFSKGLNLFENLKTKSKTIEHNFIRPLHLNECLIQKEKSIQDIDVFTTITKKLDINGDFKRIWNKKFKSGFDVLKNQIESQPLIFLE